MMTKVQYAAALKNPLWDDLRRSCLRRAGCKCEFCGKSGVPIHAHHTFYQEGRNPWEYDVRSLRALCKDCHDRCHTRETPIYEKGAWTPESDYEMEEHDDIEPREYRQRKWDRGIDVQCVGCDDFVMPRDHPDPWMRHDEEFVPDFCPACQWKREEFRTDRE